MKDIDIGMMIGDMHGEWTRKLKSRVEKTPQPTPLQIEKQIKGEFKDMVDVYLPTKADLDDKGDNK